jgi:hypothetical protein
MTMELATQQSAALAPQSRQFDLSPQNFEQALTFANYLADSDMVPKDFKGKPGNCLIAMQWGMEIGLKPLQALQSLAVINGRPALWGDAVIALVRNSPACEYVNESDDGHTATCRVKRRGEFEQIRTFSNDDAKAAGLLGKQGPWSQYPKRMRQMRARAFALRDVFADVLRGLQVAEEVMDIPAPGQQGPAQLVEEVNPTTYPAYPADKFAENLPAWTKVMRDGRKTPDQIIAMANSKHPLTDEQKQQIREAAAPVSTGPTPAEIEVQLIFAQDEDSLNAAADLINSITEKADIERLSAIYDERMGQLA